MNKNVYVTSPLMPPLDMYIEELKKIWASKQLTNGGALHNELEQEIKKFLETENVILTANGHSALEIAIQSMQLKGEIITTPFTFASTTHAIVRAGLRPVFCDINSKDYTLDVAQIEKLINENTSAILPVHVFGNVCNVEEIEKIAKKYSLKVIYDAAHTFGEKYKGRAVTSYGDVSIISFHATKVFNTIEGGAVCTLNEEIANVALELRNFGIKNEECVEFIGQNAKMSEFHAAMGLCNLKIYESARDKRKKVVDKYFEGLRLVNGIKLPVFDTNILYNYAYFPIVVDDNYGLSRDELYNSLVLNGIFARKYFYPLTNELECYKKYNFEKTPIAKRISERILCLPLFPELEMDIVEKICEIIRNK